MEDTSVEIIESEEDYSRIQMKYDEEYIRFDDELEDHTLFEQENLENDEDIILEGYIDNVFLESKVEDEEQNNTSNDVGESLDQDFPIIDNESTNDDLKMKK